MHGFNSVYIPPSYLGLGTNVVPTRPTRNSANEYEGAQIPPSRGQLSPRFAPPDNNNPQPLNDPNLTQGAVLQPRESLRALRSQVRREYRRWEQEALPDPRENEREMSRINRVVRNIETNYSPWIDRLVERGENLANFFTITRRVIRNIRNNNNNELNVRSGTE